MITLEYVMTDWHEGYVKQVRDLQIGEEVIDSNSSGAKLTICGLREDGDKCIVSLLLAGDDSVYTFTDFSTAWLKEVAEGESVG